MANKIALMVEAERRGILPPEKAALLAEARKRGLISDNGETKAPSDVTTPGSTPRAPAPQPRFAGGLPQSAFRAATGDRIGIDTANEPAVRRYTGMFYPVVHAGAAALDLVGGGINAVVANEAQNAGNIRSAFDPKFSPSDTARGARSLTEFVNIASLKAGAPGAPTLPSAVTTVARPGRAPTLRDLTRAEQARERLATAEAAERQGIDVPAATLGSRAAKVEEKLLGNVPFASGRVTGSRTNALKQTENRVEEVASGLGHARDVREAGQAAQVGGRAFIDRTGKRGDALYTRARNLAGKTQVQSRNAVAEIDRNLAELRETPGTNAAKIKVLETLRADLVDGAGNARPLSIQAIRDLRTNTRDAIMKEGLTGTDLQRRTRGVLDAAAADIDASLAKNPRARNAFALADRYWAQRADRIDGAMTAILGKDGEMTPERAGALFETLAKGGKGSSDLNKLRAIKQSLQPDEWNEVASSLVRQFGRPANSEARDFNVGTFANRYGDMSPEAKTLFFGAPGSETRSALDDLHRVAKDLAADEQVISQYRSGDQVIPAMIATQGAQFGGALLAGNVIGGAQTAALVAGAFFEARRITSPAYVRKYTAALRTAAALQKAPTPARQRQLSINLDRQLKALGISGGTRDLTLGAAANDASLPARAMASEGQEPNEQERR